MTPVEMLDEARRLLDRPPESGRQATGSLRLLKAQWLIAEADHARVVALLDPGAPATKAHQVVMGPVRQFRTDPLPTTADTTVEDTCPSRMIDHDTGEILHCGSNHDPEDGGSGHYAPGSGWSWSDFGAMPADRPCDYRCARCVERTRDAVLDAAIKWHDDMGSGSPSEDSLYMAVAAYRKVMGR